MRLPALVVFLSLATAGVSPGAEVRVAVAANFAAAAEALGAAFKAATGDELVVSAGATGQLYAQIVQGAPFEVFLAADSRRPALAVAQGLGVPGSVFTYAVGRLVLFAPATGVGGGPEALEAGRFDHIAIADPSTAPYGEAAAAVLAALGLDRMLARKIVTGETITQAFQFVQSGNAELGFVALSQVIGGPEDQYWLVPQALHRPIEQDAVLLTKGAGNPAARAFVSFLRGTEARAIITAFGYASDDD